jgi:hypothetical protein
MMRGLVPVLIALLAGCVGDRIDIQSGHAPQPGYLCVVGRPLEPGASISWQLDRDGHAIDSRMEWNSSDLWTPRVLVLWNARGAAPLRLADGATFITWQRREDVRRRRWPKGRLELTTGVRPRPWPDVPFASNYQDYSGGYTLVSNFADVAAFARGAPALFLVLRERKGTVIDHADIDPALFARAAAEVETALAEMREVNADYRSRCEFTDDADTGIVVT